MSTSFQQHSVCPAPCTKERIEATVTVGSIPGSRTKKSQLMLYYPALESRVETAVPLFGPTSLIASIGGSLGLFLGFSCLDAALGLTRKLLAMHETWK